MFLNENVTRRGGGLNADSSSRLDSILATANFRWTHFELVPTAFSDHLILILGGAPALAPPPKPRWGPYIFKSAFFVVRAKGIIRNCLADHITFPVNGRTIKSIDSCLANCNCADLTGHTALLFDIIKRLEPIYYLTRAKHTVLFRKEEQAFTNTFNRLVNSIDNTDNLENRDEISEELNALLRSRRARVLETQASGKEINSLRKLANVGRATRYSFAKTKAKDK